MMTGLTAPAAWDRIGLGWILLGIRKAAPAFGLPDLFLSVSPKANRDKIESSSTGETYPTGIP